MTYMYSGTNLVEIDDDPKGVTKSKDNDYPNQDHGNALVPLLPAGGLLVEVADAGDGSVDGAVGDDEDQERQECHQKEVCQQDVVPKVAGVFSHRCCTYRVLLSGGVDFTGLECLIPPFYTGVEFIKPGDVPNDAEEDCGKNIDDAGET